MAGGASRQTLKWPRAYVRARHSGRGLLHRASNVPLSAFAKLSLSIRSQAATAYLSGNTNFKSASNSRNTCNDVSIDGGSGRKKGSNSLRSQYFDSGTRLVTRSYRLNFESGS